MIAKRVNTFRLIWSLAGSAFASLLAFAASPISVEYLGELRFAQLSIWILLVTFIQIFDFGISQHTTKRCTDSSNLIEIHEIIRQNNSILIIIIFFLTPISLLIPKPISSIYITISETQWVLLKISVLLNLKIIYNQCAFVILDKQSQFSFLQIIIVFCRFIFPTMVFYVSDNFTIVIIYFLISSIIIVLCTDIHLGLNSYSKWNFSSIFRNIRPQIKLSFKLYLSGAVAIILGVLDRIIASYTFDVATYAKYIATFTLASAVNIVVLPFYRFFIGSMRASSRTYNQKNALRISVIQSYACLLAIGFICQYGEQAIGLIGSDFPIDITLLVIFTLSLWGAANGWIIASEIMLHDRPTLQAHLITATMLLYFFYLLFQQEVSPVDLSVIWAIHGMVQTFACPVWMSEKFKLARYVGWIGHVVLKPVLIVGALVFASYSSSWVNAVLSPVLFVSGAIILGILVIRGGTIEKMVSGK
jgi:O-antigen/teichoic acid export membrane protein